MAMQSVSGLHFHSPSISVNPPIAPVPSILAVFLARPVHPSNHSPHRPSLSLSTVSERHTRAGPCRAAPSARNRPMFSPEHRSPSLSTRTESPYRRCHITVRRSPSEFGMPIDIKALGAAPVSLPLFAGSSQEVSPHSHSRRPRARAGAMRANLVPG